jgi:hypothetical protein
VVVLQDGRVEAKGLLECTVKKRALIIHHINRVVLDTLNFVAYLFLNLRVPSKLIEHPLVDASAIGA